MAKWASWGMRIYKLRISVFPKSLPLPLLVGVPLLLLLLAFWLAQQNNVNSLARQITDLKQQIDALPATVVPKDKQLALKKDLLILEKDRVNAQNAIYGTLVQAVGSVFFVVTGYFAWRNLKATEANVKATEEKQVTERFSKAVEQLGNDNIHVRLGGIYALERIANDSKKDYWQVVEILTAYVREKAPLASIKKNEGVPFRLHNTEPVEEQKEYIPPISTDIQAVLTILARRKYAFGKGEEHPLDLRKTNLQRANLVGANLQEAFLEGANLQEAFLEGANLQEAFLLGANLQGARLEGAILKDVVDLRLAVGLIREQISEIDQEKSNIDAAMLPDYLRTPESSQPQPPDPEQT